MTVEFLFFANLILLLRLPLLLGERPAPRAAWWLKTLFEWAALLLYSPQLNLLLLAFVSLGLNVLSAPGPRFRAWGVGAQLGFGLVQLLLASVLLAPAWTVEFRPGLAQLPALVREHLTFGEALVGVFDSSHLLVALGYLLAANEANLLIRWLLGRLDLKPGLAQDTPINRLEYRRGRTIGLIERAMIYGFVVAGEFTAVGFVLAAKGFSRSRDLKQEDRDFVDYIIIGTLLSAGLAILVAAGVRAMR